jgi:hypothetical protein
MAATAGAERAGDQFETTRPMPAEAEEVGPKIQTLARALKWIAALQLAATVVLAAGTVALYLTLHQLVAQGSAVATAQREAASAAVKPAAPAPMDAILTIKTLADVLAKTVDLAAAERGERAALAAAASAPNAKGAAGTSTDGGQGANAH